MAETEQEAMELRQQATGLVQWAHGLIVASKADADHAQSQRVKIKAIKTRWLAFWNPMVESANKTHKQLTARRNEGTQVCEQADDMAEQKILLWQQAEQEKAAAEQRRLQAIEDERARKARLVQEQAAAAARAREDEARRQAEAARAAAAAAQGKERDRLNAEAEKREREQAAAAAKAAERDERAAAVFAPVVSIQAQTAAGGGMRSTWRAEVVDMAALIAAATPGSVAASLLAVNQKAADAFARSTKGMVPVAGIRFVEVSGISVRSNKQEE